MRSAITILLVPEARGGPFVFWDDLASGCRKAAAVGTGAGWLVHKLRLSDPDRETRGRAREFIAAFIDLAADFGAPAIIGSMQGRWDDRAGRDQALNWLTEAVEALAARAARHGVPLLIKPLNRYETNLLNRVEDSLAYLSRLRKANVKLLCDLFHMNIEKTSLADSLRLAGPRLGHVHLADSNRRAIGFGHTDLKPVVQALREIGFAGYLSGEILPLPDSDTAAKQTIASFKKWAL